jgi:PIN domain nuclease of toxin-antitoxin system
MRLKLSKYILDASALLASLHNETTITKPLGLSLADRACLALAKIRNAVAVTGDKSWAEIPGISVKVIIR